MKKLKQLAILALVLVVISTGCKKDEKEAVVFPLVASTIPIDKAVDVPLSQVITATFDKKMDAATITQASFILQQGTTAVSGTVSYSGSVASFAPSIPLISNTLYAGTIKTLAKDELGNALEADYKWSFTTIPQVTLSSNPAVGGTTNGAGTFTRGSAVTVTASPNTGYSFVSWTEGTTIVSPDASYTSPLNANRILVANFALNTYALNVTATNGTVLKNPDLAAYTSGATVQLTATPNSGYTFTSWSGDATGSTNPLPVVLTTNKNITANFTAVDGFTLNVTAINGTVVRNTNLAVYKSGAYVRLTATSSPGYRFTSWGGDATGSTNPLTITMNANKNITANFVEADTKSLQALIDQCATNGTVTIPAGTYYIDALISLNLKSNMTLNMESGAILKAIPNSSTSYNIIRISNATNVNVVGGTVQGDRNGHIGDTGEWGMGIGILGASNVTVSNLTAKDCWGDGFYIGSNSKNITLDNVIADNNRRQGLSITSADGVVVKNSIFKNTFGIAPEAGIDIEPNAGLTVQNVQILNSQILSNLSFGITLNAVAANSKILKVTIDGCTIKGNSNAGAGFLYTNGHNFTNNTVTEFTAGLKLVSGGNFYSIGNTITGNIFTTPIGSAIMGDDGTGKNTISGNTFNPY